MRTKISVKTRKCNFCGNSIKANIKHIEVITSSYANHSSYGAICNDCLLNFVFEVCDKKIFTKKTIAHYLAEKV